MVLEAETTLAQSSLPNQSGRIVRTVGCDTQGSASSSYSGDVQLTLETNSISDYVDKIKGILAGNGNSELTDVRIRHKGTHLDVLDQLFDVPIPSCSSQATRLPTMMPSTKELHSVESTEVTTSAVRTISTGNDENPVDQQLTELVVSAGERATFEKMVSELINVEGYETESWGSAVDITNLSLAFYPTKLTCPLQNEEFDKFMEISDSDDLPDRNQENFMYKSSNQDVTAGVAGEQSVPGLADSQDKVEMTQKGVERVENVENHLEGFVDPFRVPTDPRRLSSERVYSKYLDNLHLQDIPEDAITADYVLQLVLNEVEKHVEPEEVSVTHGLELECADDKNDLNDASEETCDGNEKLLSGPKDTLSELQVETISKEDKTENDVPQCAQTAESEVAESESSLQDPRLNRKLECSSQVSVASSSSSHSSVKPCSVVLTRLSPVRLTSSKNISDEKEASCSVVNKGRQTDTADEHDENDTSILTHGDVENSDEGVSEKNLEDHRNEHDVESSLNLFDEGENSAHSTALNKILDAEKSIEKDVSSKNSGRSKSTLTKIRTAMNKSKVTRKKRTTKKKKVTYGNLKTRGRLVRQENIINQTNCDAIPIVKTEIKMEVDDDDDNHTVVAPTRQRKSERKRTSETFVSADVKTERMEMLTEKAIAKMTLSEAVHFIENETKKSEPDFTRLSEAMSKTYEGHRKVIYEKCDVSIDDIMKFQGLQYYEMVKEEYGRIKGDIKKMENLEEELNEVLLNALEPTKEKGKTFPSPKKRKKKHALWEDALKLWEEKKPSPDYQKVLGIVAVSFKLVENNVVKELCKVLKTGETLTDRDIEKMKTPTIVIYESDVLSIKPSNEIWIYVDCTQVLRVPNFYEAVLSVFASYYMFNIAYNKKLKALFEFFDFLNGNPQSTNNPKKSVSRSTWLPNLKSFLRR